MHLGLQTSDDSAERDRASDAAPVRVEATEVQVAPPELLAPVLSRALAALAARHEITVDRISDAMLLSDAISAGAPAGFADGRVRLTIADRPEGVELRIGPMQVGGAERLRGSLALPEVGGSIEMLADELRVEQGDDGEFLVVAIAALSA
jgi:hypothetical protein